MIQAHLSVIDRQVQHLQNQIQLVEISVRRVYKLGFVNLILLVLILMIGADL